MQGGEDLQGPEKKAEEGIYPWLGPVGVLLVVLGVISLLNADRQVIGAVEVVVGVLLIATRLIQQSIERSRR